MAIAGGDLQGLLGNSFYGLRYIFGVEGVAEDLGGLAEVGLESAIL